MKLLAFLALRSPVLNFLNLLSSRVLLSYKPLSYKKIRVLDLTYGYPLPAKIH